jgi:LysM repeat protein
MTESGRRRNPLRPRTVSGTPPGSPPGPPPAPPPAESDDVRPADAGEQEPVGWFREETDGGAAGPAGVAAGAGSAGTEPAIAQPDGDEPVGEAPVADDSDAGQDAAVDATMAAGWSEEAELVEVSPGTEAVTAATVPVAAGAPPAAGVEASPRRGSAARRLRTLVVAVLVVALTAVLGFAAGTLLPSLLPGPGIAVTPTDEPTEAPTLAPTVEPTDAPTLAPTLAPTEAPTPEPTATPAATPKPTIHVVRAGETLTAIAATYGVSVKAIQDLNGIENANRIFPGQKLKIPPKS